MSAYQDITSHHHAELARKRDLLELSRIFQATLDISQLTHLWMRDRPRLERWGDDGRHTSGIRSQNFSFLGSGLTFSAWKIKSHASRSTGRATTSMELVLKVPHSTPDQKLGPTFRDWRTNVGRCRDLVALLPPFILLEDGSNFALVMPLAPDPLATAHPHWLPLSERIAEFQGYLATKKLNFFDPLMGPRGGGRLQAGCWQGVPFIYDLSDIRPIALRP